ncbi:MAG: uracil phosphoribosyltransferase, partial [Eikenella corrodens]
MNLTVIDHPLIKHKITLMRKANCNTYQFRTLVKELARLMAYEASRHLETEPLSIEGWCGRIEGEQIKGKTVTVVPILRAGLGMLDGVLD